MDVSNSKFERVRQTKTGALICGAAAGLAVDLTLFPIDTIKTRLQSERGFRLSGGFGQIYSGIPSVAIGSAPGAALFFATYETSKRLLTPFVPHASVAHMTAASLGEVVACLVRVPTEVLKQRVQAFPNRSVRFVAKRIRRTEGYKGFYRGYWSTIVREVPFSLIQFPIWEWLKVKCSQWRQKTSAGPLESAACGSVAGSIAAGITTPLDVVKTRIMLAEKLHGHAEGKVWPVLVDLWKAQGLRALFAGVIPRVCWLALGGFVFFGAYETATLLYLPLLTTDEQMRFELETGRYQFLPSEVLGRLVTKYSHYYNRDRPKTFSEVCDLSEKNRAPNDLVESIAAERRKQRSIKEQP